MDFSPVDGEAVTMTGRTSGAEVDVVPGNTGVAMTPVSSQSRARKFRSVIYLVSGNGDLLRGTDIFVPRECRNGAAGPRRECFPAREPEPGQMDNRDFDLMTRLIVRRRTAPRHAPEDLDINLECVP